jgi:16S rRNA (uracil1498-N3)-methyltransferase
LRAQSGDVVELLDGSGRVWGAVVDRCSEDRVELIQVELLQPEAAKAGRLVLIQSLCKAEKLEWLLEKCTEIGIDEIYLLEAARSVVRIPKERLDAKMERWRRIVLAAVKQSRRNTFPALHPPCSLASVCSSPAPGLKLLLSEHEHTESLKQILRSSSWEHAVFCIGPEGGWTEDEHQALVRSGFRPASLGSQILRTETAAVVVAAILKYELGTVE